MTRVGRRCTDATPNRLPGWMRPDVDLRPALFGWGARSTRFVLAAAAEGWWPRLTWLGVWPGTSNRCSMTSLTFHFWQWEFSTQQTFFFLPREKNSQNFNRFFKSLLTVTPFQSFRLRLAGSPLTALSTALASWIVGRSPLKELKLIEGLCIFRSGTREKININMWRHGTAEHSNASLIHWITKPFVSSPQTSPTSKAPLWSFDVNVLCGEVSCLHNDYLCTIYTEIYGMKYGRNIMSINGA